MDWNRGILCSLTDQKPNFKVTCPDFNKDEEAVAQLEEQKKKTWSAAAILPKDRFYSSGRIKIKVINSRFPMDIPVWKKYPTYFDLPEKWEVGSRTYIEQVIVSFLVTIGLIVYGFSNQKEGVFGDVLIWFLVFFSFGFLINYASIMARVWKERKTFVTFDKSGINFENKHKFKWEEIKTFSFLSGRLNRRFSDYLVLHLEDGSKVCYDWRGLNLRMNQAGHLIKLYLKGENELKRSRNEDALFQNFVPLKKRWYFFDFLKTRKDEVVIRKANLKWIAVLIFLTGLFTPYLAWLAYGDDPEEGRFWWGIISAILAPVVMGITASKLWNESKDRTSKITLSKSGIQLKSEKLIPWEKIKYIGFSSRKGGKENMRYLLIQEEDGERHYVRIINLQISPWRIEMNILTFLDRIKNR